MVILFQENKSLQLNFIAEIISDIYGYMDYQWNACVCPLKIICNLLVNLEWPFQTPAFLDGFSNATHFSTLAQCGCPQFEVGLQT